MIHLAGECGGNFKHRLRDYGKPLNDKSKLFELDLPPKRGVNVLARYILIFVEERR
jgi:hypothetical protein